MSNEPSMEDILSSIKRIIAEDTDAALSAPRGRRSVADSSGERGAALRVVPSDDSEILELTNAVPAEEPVAKPSTASARPESSRSESPRPPRGSEPWAPEARAGEDKPKPPLVSDATLNASRSSIAALSALVVKPDIAGSDTLEGLVRDMLKPMLAEWLDQRLPDVVERLVAQEIARITTRG